jgi:hypothetical protein
MEGGPGGSVAVSVRERRGALQVSVRTPDRPLAAALRHEFGPLLERLDQAGFEVRPAPFLPELPAPGGPPLPGDERERRAPHRPGSRPVRRGRADSSGAFGLGTLTEGTGSVRALAEGPASGEPGKREQRQ